LGGQPCGLLVGAYEFSHAEEDIRLLRMLASVAATAHAPFVAGAAPELFNQGDFADLESADLAAPFADAGHAAWRDFRDSEDSCHVALTLPRLARWRQDLPSHPGSGEVVGMNAAWAYAACVTDAFARHGWFLRAGREGALPGLAAPSEGGTPPQTTLSEGRAAELSALGFLPVVQDPAHGRAAFWGAQSCHRPRSLSDPQASSAVLSANFNVLLCLSAFTRCLKVMARDALARFGDMGECERWLNDWLARYILPAADEAGEEAKVRRPLAEGRVELRQVPGTSGGCTMTVHLRPHLPLEGPTGAVRLLAAVPGPGLAGPVARRATLLRRFTGHTDSVWAVTFAPDGRRVLSGAMDGTIRLWERDTGRELRCLKGHTEGVTGIAFAGDGLRALSSSLDGTVRLWDVEGQELRRFEGHRGRVLSVALTPDGRQAVSGGEDQTVRWWDLATGKELACFPEQQGWVHSLAVAPDGLQILVGSTDLRLLELATGRPLRRLQGHTAAIRCLAFSPDGLRAVSGGEDRTLHLWDLGRGDSRRCLTGHADWVRGVAFSPDGRCLLSGSDDETVRLWDAATGEERGQLLGHDWSVVSVAFAPQGDAVLSGSDDQTVALWQL
jgi:hypothetical protein